MRRRWNREGGGSVEIVDLGGALVIVPEGLGGLRAILESAVRDAGGYPDLAKRVVAEEPDLA